MALTPREAELAKQASFGDDVIAQRQAAVELGDMQEVEITEDSDVVSVEITDEYTDNAEIHESGVTSAMVALDQGRDPAQAYLRATESGNVQGMVDAWNQSTTEDRLAMMQGQVEIAPVEKIKEEAVSFSNDMSGTNGVLGPYIQKIKSMPSSIGKSEEEIRETALLAYHRQVMSDYHPTGVGEAVGDIAGVFVPKRKAEAVIDVAREMGFIDTFVDKVDVFIDPTDELNRMRGIYLQLKGEEKAQYIDMVKRAVDKSSDNNIIKSTIMDGIFGAGTERLDPFFEIVDLAAIGEVGIVAAKMGKHLAKSSSIVNAFRKLKAHDTVAETIAQASHAQTAAARVGITQADTADAVNPLINNEVADLLEGASEDMSAQVAHMIDLQNERFKAVLEATPREGVIDKQTMDEVMRAAEIEQLKQPGVIDTRILKSDETGFTLQYATAHFDEAGELKVRLADKQVDFKIGQTGKIESPIDEYHTAFNRLDPNARMSGRLRNWFVHTVEKMARAQEKTAFSFDNMMKDAFKGLKGKFISDVRGILGFESRSAAKVDQVLLQGAKEGKNYNFNDLVNVGVGPNSLRLTEKEAKAYIGVRNIVNHMYSLKNKQIVDNFLAMGIKLVDGFDGVTPARVFDTPEGALKGWNEIASDSRWINVADDGLKVGEAPIRTLKLGKKAELTPKMIEEAYEAGYVLAKNHAQSQFFKRDEFRTQWAFVRKESAISPRGQQVINKLPGYIPKQRTNGYYFIKSKRAGILSGADKSFETGHTVAWADTAKSADDWIASQDDPSKFVKVFDRELTPEQQMLEISATHGGMYSGARKSTELPFVGEAKAEFADSFEAMQHYINHIGRQYPASLYRLGSEQRLLAVASSVGVKGARGLHDVLPKAIASGLKPASKEYRMLEDIHNQVSFINMIPTDDELNISKRMEAIGNALEVPLLKKIPGWNKVPKFFYNRAAANIHPADTMRGFTFNHLLGMYNPAQILVQFSGAMVSFAVAPVQFTKAMPKAIGWATLDLSMSDPRTQARMIKWMKQNDMEEFADSYQLWARSGYRESVINGNADYTSVFMKNLPYDAGILRKAMANHTIFYKMGELANTRMAFATAIERYKKQHNVTKIDPNDDSILDIIGKDAEALRLNMSRANQSDLNKGWKSVPLQFQQVIAKYFEKVLPKGFGGTDELTGAEKARLAAFPTMMTGIAGIPLGQHVAIEMLDLMGIDETELSPGETQAIKMGAIGWMMGEALDINVDLASRMTLGADVTKKMYEALTGNRSMWQWLGASSTVLDRYYRNGQYLAEAFDLSTVQNENINMDSLKFMASVLKEIAIDTPTVGRNFKQYASYFFTQNPQFIKDGKYIFELETMNDRTAFFAIMGFQPQEISEIYEIDKEINDGRSAFALFGDADADIIRRVLNTHILNDSAPVEHQALGAQMVNSILKKYGDIEAAELMEKVWQKSYNKRFDQNDLLIKFLMESEKRMQDGLDVLNTMISRKLQELREQ